MLYLTCSRVICLELLINHFLIKLLINIQSSVKQSSDIIRFLKFSNPCKNFVEAAFDFNQMKSTWKFFSANSKNLYHIQRHPPQQLPWSFFLQKNVYSFQPLEAATGVVLIKNFALKSFQNLQENISDTVSFLLKLQA